MSVSTAEYEALRHGLGGVETLRDLVTATGPDTTDFLQGQLSQDVTGMAIGASAWALLLQPTGKMDALLRATRRAENEWLLDVEVGWGEQVLSRLNRFKLRTDCELEVREVRAVVLRGPESVGLSDTAALVSASVDWGGLPGIDLLGGEVALADGALACSPEALNVVRIEAGVAAMGNEIDESTIPAEAGVVDGAVSFTKGCFTGQELVARIDSRGSNTPRRLHGLVFELESALEDSGGPLHDGSGAEVGRVTSYGMSPGYGSPVALAYLRRGVEPGDHVSLDGNSAAVHELPMFPG